MACRQLAVRCVLTWVIPGGSSSYEDPTKPNYPLKGQSLNMDTLGVRASSYDRGQAHSGPSTSCPLSWKAQGRSENTATVLSSSGAFLSFCPFHGCQILTFLSSLVYISHLYVCDVVAFKLVFDRDPQTEIHLHICA